MKKIILIILAIAVSVLCLFSLNGCGSVKRNKTVTIKDSTIIREFDVPVKIKETTIRQNISMDSLCMELEAIKSELKRTKSNGATIIYRDSNRGVLEARLDSLGNLLLTAQIKALDTLIKGKETITVKTKEKTKTVEKEGSKWWMWLILGVALALVAPNLIKLIMKTIKPL
jgi:hypothetical protein